MRISVLKISWNFGSFLFKPTHDAGVQVSIVNPAQVRSFAFGLAIRNKTDDMDSFVLARYGAIVQPRIWIPPSQEANAIKLRKNSWHYYGALAI